MSTSTSSQLKPPSATGRRRGRPPTKRSPPLGASAGSKSPSASFSTSMSFAALLGQLTRSQSAPEPHHQASFPPTSVIQRSHSYPARLEEPTGYVSSPGWEPPDISGGLEVAWPAPGFSAGPGGDRLSEGGSSGAPAAWLSDIPSGSGGGTEAASTADWAAAASSTDPRGSADSLEAALQRAVRAARRPVDLVSLAGPR